MTPLSSKEKTGLQEDRGEVEIDKVESSAERTGDQPDRGEVEVAKVRTAKAPTDRGKVDVPSVQSSRQRGGKTGSRTVAPTTRVMSSGQRVEAGVVGRSDPTAETVCPTCGTLLRPSTDSHAPAAKIIERG